MIVEYQPNGRIFHIVSDPVPPGLVEVMQAHGATFLNSPPVPWPPEPDTDPDTGAIRLSPDGNPIMVSRGIDSIPCDMATDYVLDGVVMRRPVIEAAVSKTEIIADDTDEAVISGLPDPITVNIDGTDHVIEGGELVIASDMPATYRITIDQFPYMPWSVEIIANAS